ncbi:MAG: LPXTG cell wall anchor domain-containing protein [Lacisediminihabitans sp.]
MKKLKFFAGFTTALLALGVALSAGPAAWATESNQPDYWQTTSGERCVDVGYSTEDSADHPYTLPASDAGRTYSKVIVKAGSTDHSVANENEVYRTGLIEGATFVHPEKDSISHVIVCTLPSSSFDENWQYAAPTCGALTVSYPGDIPAGQADDVNIRIEHGTGYSTTTTLNFHNNDGTWSGRRVFTYSSSPNWPNDIGPYKVVWTQVSGTNYHRSDDISCGETPLPKGASSASVNTTAATCGAPERLVLGTTTFATWGTPSLSRGPGDYSVTASAVTGHLFGDGTTVETFTGTLAGALDPNSPSCRGTVLITLAADPTAVNEVCTGGGVTSGYITVALADHVSYRIVGTSAGSTVDINPTSTNTDLPPGDYRVAAAADSGYTIKDYGGPWLLTIAPAVDCGQLVTHPLVTPTLTSTDRSCTAAGSYTLDAVTGVLWTVDGKPVAAGTYAVKSAKTVNVVATADAPDYGLESGAQTQWTLTFTDPQNCSQLTTLAFTGSDSAPWILTAAGLLLMGAGIVLIRRRRVGRLA